jgi:hypothetical protein
VTQATVSLVPLPRWVAPPPPLRAGLHGGDGGGGGGGGVGWGGVWGGSYKLLPIRAETKPNGPLIPVRLSAAAAHRSRAAPLPIAPGLCPLAAFMRPHHNHEHLRPGRWSGALSAGACF